MDTSIELPVEPAAVSEPPAQLDTTPNENEIMNKTEDTSVCDYTNKSKFYIDT